MIQSETDNTHGNVTDPMDVNDLILASASPRRRKLLEQLGLKFSIDIPDISETVEPGLKPSVIVERLADRKASACCGRHRDSLIIGADTLVVLDDQVLGKPVDRKHAAEMLNRLSGRTHSVFTGVVLLLTDKTAGISRRIKFHEQTKVTFSTLSPEEIEVYIKSGSPMDKAGAYGIQDDMGALFVSGINGDFYNVVGLPVHRLYHCMKEIAPGFFNRNIGQHASHA